MDFRKYHSIENAYREKFLWRIRQQPVGCADGEWVVTEKIHGSNLSFTTDGTEFKLGKRTAFLEEEEMVGFFNCQGIFDRYRGHIAKLFALLDASPSRPRVITVYGELFGGAYPGHASPPGVPKIQKGISYHPDHDFCAFDIRADGVYLDYDVIVRLFEHVGLFYARPLFRGSLDEVLRWSGQHKADVTTIPAHFGLPPVEGNIREGHVIKPVKSAWLPSGDAVVIKDKNDKFSETKVRKAPREPEPVPSELQAAIDDVLLYVTQQRYDNVVSKFGTVTKTDTGKLVGMLSKDALEDYHKEPHSGPKLEKPQLKILNKAVNEAALKIVMENVHGVV